MSPGPTPDELLAARRHVGLHHPRTPLRVAEELSARSGAEVLVKCENEAPVRSFKARGPLWSLSRLDDAARRAGVVTASTGNHAQGVAYAGRLLGIDALVVMPEGASDVKVARTRALGATVQLAGGGLSDAEAQARRIAEEEGRHYLEDGEDPGLMAGAASIAWEIFEQAPDAAVIVVPVGGGNLIAAIGLVARRLNPGVQVVGVQSEAAPAVERSFAARRMLHAPCETMAGGLATSHPGQLALDVMSATVDAIELVSEADLGEHVVRRLESSGQLIEPAAAAAFALLERSRDRWRGERVVVVQTGGNVSLGELRRLLAIPMGGS